MKYFVSLFLTFVFWSSAAVSEGPALSISSDGRTMMAAEKPFFWLGDTAWLLLPRLNREETEHYLATRKQQGFNVIQIMILHSNTVETVDGVPALLEGDLSRPNVTPGNSRDQKNAYDYWDHLDWVLERAEAHGLYLALVPAWGSVAKEGHLTEENAAGYGEFLAKRYGGRNNIIWLNGGDIFGTDATIAWAKLGRAIKAIAPSQLMTFHPRGRTDSSFWFHNAPWLDFNMYQSGHKTYDQDMDARGEDNWSFAEEDWARKPAKPFIDGEPSYENIPYGLHKADVPRWSAAEVRRYAWWSVLSGAFGHTYGENSVMQMYVPGRHNPAYHATKSWKNTINAKGARQMKFVRALMEARPFIDRQPNASLVVDNGERYERVPVLHGKDYLFAYAYTGRNFTLKLGVLSGKELSANWYSPSDGSVIPIGTIKNKGEHRFDPPGYARPGSDWVLVLDDASAGYKLP